MAGALRELDSLTVVDLVDNEIDFLSQPCGCYKRQQDGLRYESSCLHQIKQGKVDFQTLPDGEHGLSLLCIGELDGERRAVLFDAGATPELFASNVTKLADQVDLSLIDEVVLSHWHSDHSGGFRGAVPLINRAREAAGRPPVVANLQEDWPSVRALKLPTGMVAEMAPSNPSPEEFRQLGASVCLDPQAHAICQGFFHVSGPIPRETDFEGGFPGHLSRFGEEGDFVPDEDILDERYLACRIKGIGLVVLSACSHAGIVNICNDATKTLGGELCAVVGGLHLSGSAGEELRVKPTIEAMKELSPRIVLAGHCTGWKAKAMLSEHLGDTFQPLSVGGRYHFAAPAGMARGGA